MKRWKVLTIINENVAGNKYFETLAHNTEHKYESVKTEKSLVHLN